MNERTNIRGAPPQVWRVTAQPLWFRAGALQARGIRLSWLKAPMGEAQQLLLPFKGKDRFVTTFFDLSSPHPCPRLPSAYPLGQTVELGWGHSTYPPTRLHLCDLI